MSPGYLRSSSGFSTDARAGLVCDDPGMILRTRKQPGSPAITPGSGTGRGAPGDERGEEGRGPQPPGDLVISVRTVESHVSSVLRKLQLSNRRELSRWATARRLV